MSAKFKNVDIAVIEAYKQAPKTYIRNYFLIIIMGLLLYWSYSVIVFQPINEQGWIVVKGIMENLIIPDFDKLLSTEKFGIPYLMYETIMIGVLGTIFGALIAIPFAFVSSRNITGNIISFLGAILIAVIRTFPIFIWGLMFIRVAPGAFAGVLAIAVSSIGMISKLYIEAIEDIDVGIIEALDSTGCNAIQKVRYGIIPQLTANFISTAIYRFEINVKNATILGMVGAGGIGFTLMDALGSFNFPVVGAALWGIIATVLVIEFFSTKIRTKLING